MNKIDLLFKKKNKNILSVYYTAGFPEKESTSFVLDELINNQADIIEIGIPFSDPLADGEVIQKSSHIALQNGMTLKYLFEQLKNSTIKKSDTPLILMGYLNPILQLGVELFCELCAENNISGAIIPDLPFDEYNEKYKTIFEKYNLKNIFLITPQTSEERIRLIDKASDAFIYVVSSASTTGKTNATEQEQINYFARIKAMDLKNPLLIGFGISDKASFVRACEYANGAIIGTAFINQIAKAEDLKSGIKKFIENIKN